MVKGRQAGMVGPLPHGEAQKGRPLSHGIGVKVGW